MLNNELGEQLNVSDVFESVQAMVTFKSVTDSPPAQIPSHRSKVANCAEVQLSKVFPPAEVHSLAGVVVQVGAKSV